MFFGNIKENKDRTRPNITIDEIFEYDLDTPTALLDEYCARADFVFNLAGVNRPKDPEEFMKGNFGFSAASGYFRRTTSGKSHTIPWS